MSSEDFAKKIQDVMVKSLTGSGDGLPDTALMLAEVQKVFHDIQDAGILPTEEVAKLSVQLAELETLTKAAAALTNDAFAGLDAASERAEMLAALDQTSTDRPEIFGAIEDGNVEGVKRALKGWDINQTYGEYQRTALYAAMSDMFSVSLEIVDILLDAGADPQKGLMSCNVLGGLGFGSFRDIPARTLADRIKRCVHLGADLEQRSCKLQWTPLHLALDEWNVVASEALLLAGADPDARVGIESRSCTAGQNCLSMMISYPELFELLLNYGADPKAADAEGCTIADEVAQLLANPDAEYLHAEALLCQAALKRHEKPI